MPNEKIDQLLAYFEKQYSGKRDSYLINLYEIRAVVEYIKTGIKPQPWYYGELE